MKKLNSDFIDGVSIKFKKGLSNLYTTQYTMLHDMEFRCLYAYEVLINKCVAGNQILELKGKIEEWLLQNSISEYKWSTAVANIFVGFDVVSIPLYLWFRHGDDMAMFKLRFGL